MSKINSVRWTIFSRRFALALGAIGVIDAYVSHYKGIGDLGQHLSLRKIAE